MKLVAEGLRSGKQFQVLAFCGVLGENRRPGKTEQVVIFKRLDNLGVHIPELAAVALIEDNDAMLSIYGVASVFCDKVVQLLDGCNDNTGFCVLQLPLQDRR